MAALLRSLALSKIQFKCQFSKKRLLDNLRPVTAMLFISTGVKV
jgi:hypothetical protein